MYSVWSMVYYTIRVYGTIALYGRMACGCGCCGVDLLLSTQRGDDKEGFRGFGGAERLAGGCREVDFMGITS